MNDPSQGVAVPHPIVKTDQFMGITIRIARSGELPAIPINDIADGIEYDRSALRKLYSRNKEMLKEFAGSVRMPSPRGGAQLNTCLTREGVIGILMKLDYKRIKSPEKKERIVKFQQWAIRAINTEMQIQAKLQSHEAPAPTPAPSGTVTEAIHRHMEAARTLHRELGVPLDLAQAKALVLAGRDLHMDLTGFARLLPAAAGPTPLTIAVRQIMAPSQPIDTQGYLSASEIAQLINRRNGSDTLKGKHINTYLKQKGYVYRREEDGRYCMTDKGAEYGKVFPFAARSGHVDYFLRWKPEVMQASGMIR